MRIPSWTDTARSLSLSPILQETIGPNDNWDRRSHELIKPGPELPGGSPFSFCEVSRSTDLFNITSVEVTHQPIHIDDVFLIHIYGSFLESYKPNATISLTVDCGSHCEDYGVPPEDRHGETFPGNFCDFAEFEQPTGGRKKNETCTPEKGCALVTQEAYIWPMFIRAPGWYNFTIDVTTKEDERVFCVTSEVCLRWEDEKKNEGYPKGPWTNCSWPR